MLVLIFSLIFSVLYSVSAVNSNIYVQCSQLCFELMTPYESNVNSLFTTLADSASVSNFNKFEISQSDVVYGFYQCRGDLSSSDCRDCVGNSVSQLKSTCPLSIGAIIKLDGCLVKYDNTLFFGVDDKIEVLKRCGPSGGSNSDVLNSADDLLTYLVSGNGQYFRKRDSRNIEGVAQCVQDLSVSDCQDCISEASQRLRSECDNSISGEMYLGKCYIQYGDNGKDKNNCNDCCKGDDSGVMTSILISLAGSVISGIVSIFVSRFTSRDYYLTVRHEVKQLEKKANESQDEVKEVRAIADKTHKRVDDFESRIDTLSERSSVQNKTNNSNPYRFS